MLLVLPASCQLQPQLDPRSPGALEALGACVAECCLGPVLPGIEQVASAAAAVASATSLSELTTALTCSLSAALSAELHVDLTVRLAVLPYRDASAGVLFSTATDGTTSKSGTVQPPSPLANASPRPGTQSRPPTGQQPLLLSQTRQVQSSRNLDSTLPSPFTSQAALRGSRLLQSPRYGANAAAVVLDDEAPEVTLTPKGAASRRNTVVGLVAASNTLAAASPAVSNNGVGPLMTSIGLEALLGSRPAPLLRHAASGSLAGPMLTQRVAWKACPFTSSSTLLAALMGRRAGAEVGRSASQQLAASQASGATVASSGGAGVAATLGALGARPLGGSSLALRAQTVPNVPAFLHDFESPSKDVFSIVKRAGVGGGLASLIAMSAVWTGTPRALLLPPGIPDASFGGAPELGDVARLPALGVYIYSALPLPQSLLLAARDQAASLLKVLAPGVIRGLSWGPLADQWVVLTGQATAGTEGARPASTRVLEGIATAGGGSTVLGASPDMGPGAIHAFIVDAAADSFQPLVTSGASDPRVIQAADLPSGGAKPGSRSTTAMQRTLAHAEVTTAAMVAGGSAGGAVGDRDGSLKGKAKVSAGGHAWQICVLEQAVAGGAPSAYASGGRTTLGPGQFAKMQPSSSLVISRSAHIPVASPQNTYSASVSGVNLAGLSTSENNQPPGRFRTFLSSATRKSIEDRTVTTTEVPRGEFARCSEVMTTAGDLVGNVEAETASDLGAVAHQHQMATLVTAFTTTLARSRTETDLQGSSHAEDDIRALAISRPIGQGACSVVMLGRLHAMPVAVKVILPLDDDDAAADSSAGNAAAADGPTGRSRSKQAEQALLDNQPLWSGPYSSPSGDGGPAGSKDSRTALARVLAARGTTLRRRKRLQALMRGARELAVLTSISHPNIVQVYSYCTRVVVEEPEPCRPRLRVVPEGAEADAPVCSALIMEFCDMGSLADAIDTGFFTKAAKRAAARPPAQQQPSGAPGSSALQPVPPSVAATAGTPAMRAVYLTLLEVALALRHLHSMNLVHCDVKPANVLLRSSATDPRGFTAKLTDFGFVNLVSSPAERGDGGAQGSQQQEPVGTVTHMAPELFANGGTVDWSIDCYAFGILMWETYTGRAPYPEYADTNFAEVPDKVSKEGLRPRFPTETPLHFKTLATECWAAKPGLRPTAASLVVRLQSLLDASCGNA
ncbi:hypothetical protein HYH03_014529 [Edaphochlamys debaryana]|uniref:Protein kinase domain-containing protein n=1 Tax=Edaphochlamys debaryana TaxID=47281 RepID=A0A835XRD2_9CHLO|nr:hypothetical protein HYH03_014529 [Edaphochlamys debaryana]|eukprot:KAG2486846.1 hypothetical protein HYH03_014529 [Edaphochlamys debaryana]